MENLSLALGAVGIYVALNFFILGWLGNETGKLRRKHKIAIGHGDNKHLERIMRGHANASENMPIFFIGLTIAALMDTPSLVVHGLGLVFTIGRAIHAYHFIKEDAAFSLRVAGFGLALLAMVILFVGLLAHGLWALI